MSVAEPDEHSDSALASNHEQRPSLHIEFSKESGRTRTGCGSSCTVVLEESQRHWTALQCAEDGRFAVSLH